MKKAVSFAAVALAAALTAIFPASTAADGLSVHRTIAQDGGAAASASSADTAVKPGLTKDESVFLILNPDGSVREQTVSCWLHSDGGMKGVEDQSNLKTIRNVKTDVSPSLSGNKVTWNTGDQDVYYSGTSDQTPPVSASITYKLDGRDISAQDLTGKSGKLEMSVKLANHQKQTCTIGGVQRDIYTPFAVAVVANLPADVFTGVDAGGGNVISDSSNQIVNFIGLPGVKENFEGVLDSSLIDLGSVAKDEFTIKATVKGFTMPSILLAAATNLADLNQIDLNDRLTDLSDGIGQLKNATDQLKQGTAQLSDALRQYNAGMGSLQAGYRSFDEGLLDAIGGASQLKSGTAQLKQAADLLRQQVTDQLIPGLTGSAALQQQLEHKMAALSTQLAGLEIPDMTALQQQLATAIGQVSDASASTAAYVLSGKTLEQLAAGTAEEQAQAQAIANGLTSIKANAGSQIGLMLSQLDMSALEGLQTSFTEIDALSTQLMGAMNTLTSSLYNPSDDPHNPHTLAGAILGLAVGADGLDAGASDLSGGMNTLGSYGQSIQMALDTLKSASGQLAGSGAELAGGMADYQAKAITPLCDSDMIGKLNTALEIKDAMSRQVDAYRSYSGAPDGAKVTLKFIMKVSGPEETAQAVSVQAPSQPETHQSFWSKIAQFFKNLF